MMSYLKRRFSSSDLQDELKEDNLRMSAANIQEVANVTMSTTDMSSSNYRNINRKPASKGPSPSLPSSPTKNISFADSVMNVARGIMSNSTSFSANSPYTNTATPIIHTTKEKAKILLVIDDEHTDWSKYFRSRRTLNECEIRVEQAEFKDINLAAYSDTGTMIDLNVVRNGSRVVRSFRPDFVLIRQHVTDSNINWKNIIIGLQYGGIPCINSLSAVYNFTDRAWVFAELIKINRRLGNDAFPLINQAYYPDYKEMLTSSTFPCIIKIGNGHQGLGKVKVENPYEFQDITSIVAMSNSYATTEPFVECKYDIRIQKIGSNYKAFMRKSITRNWKSNTGSAMLEQIPVSDVYKIWIDDVAKMFDGLDVCAIEAVIGQDGKEFIIEANGCSFTLLGESQEDDRRNIADLVIEKWTQYLKKPVIDNAQVKPTRLSQSVSDSHNGVQIEPLKTSHTHNNTQAPFTSPLHTPSVQTTLHQSTRERENVSGATSNIIANNSVNSGGGGSSRQLPTIPNRHHSPTPYQNAPQSQATNENYPKPQSNTVNTGGNNLQNQNFQRPTNINTPSSMPSPATSTVAPRMPRPPVTSQYSLPQSKSPQPNPNNPQAHGNGSRQTVSQQNSEDTDDTMKNLRKTFAGIFGEMMS